MKIVVLDTETSYLDNINPFHTDAKLYYIGLRVITETQDFSKLYPIEYGDEPYGHHLKEIQQHLEEADLIIGFNIKFDLNWVRRYIPTLNIKDVWDCQVVEFILVCQQEKRLSLDWACERRGLPTKIDKIKTEYWDQGIDTGDIPQDELEEYLQQDLDITYDLYKAQKRDLQDSPKAALVELCNQDVLVLREMEENGLPYFDEEAALSEDERLEAALESNRLALDAAVNPPCLINWDSPAQVSAVIFGGKIKVRTQGPSERLKKDGTPVDRIIWKEDYVSLPGLLGGSSKWGINSRNTSERGSVDYDTLVSLSWGKHGKIRDLLISRREISKLRNTYLEGLLRLRERMGWKKGSIHALYNQCIVVTGRLSSSKPNAQNIPNVIRKLFKC